MPGDRQARSGTPTSPPRRLCWPWRWRRSCGPRWRCAGFSWRSRSPGSWPPGPGRRWWGSLRWPPHGPSHAGAAAGCGSRPHSWWCIALVGFTVRLATDRDPLRYERVRIWAVALRVAAAEFPLGCGPSGYADAAMAHNFPREGEFARFARLPDVAESDLLQLAATLGLPGVMLLVGLAWSVVRRLPKADARAWGVLAAAVVTSAFNSQLMVPAVAWTLALAVGSVLPRVVLRRERASRWATVAAVAAVAVATGAVLALPDFGAGERARASGGPRRRGPAHPACRRHALADAEALTWQACAARPRYGRGWRILGSIRLRRAALCGEADVAAAAAEAFAPGAGGQPVGCLGGGWGGPGAANAG